MKLTFVSQYGILNRQQTIREDHIMKQNNRLSTQDITQIGLMTAAIAVLAQISIPMPAGVPMTMQTFAVPLAGILLGARKGTFAVLAYLLLGAAGVPVYAGFAAGVGKLFGITGGFLLSFPIMSWLAGKGEEKKSMPWLIASLVLGAVLNYIIGMCWFVFVAESSFAAAFTACVLPFIPTAIIKVLMAAFLGKELRSALVKAQVLTAA